MCEKERETETERDDDDDDRSFKRQGIELGTKKRIEFSIIFIIIRIENSIFPSHFINSFNIYSCLKIQRIQILV